MMLCPPYSMMMSLISPPPGIMGSKMCIRDSARTISTRGLKLDATHYCELVFDVNSAYFDNHGGYEFAKQFYEDAYKACLLYTSRCV